MGNHLRKADGRRVFSVVEFKRTTVLRLLTGEKTVAELNRELDILPSESGPGPGAPRPAPTWRPMRTWYGTQLAIWLQRRYGVPCTALAGTTRPHPFPSASGRVASAMLSGVEL